MESLFFDGLIQLLNKIAVHLPDFRKSSPNTKYAISDAMFAAFAVFFMQSPSFLASQRQMRRKKGKSNAKSLFELEEIPGDTQIRTLLDPIKPSFLYPLFLTIFHLLEKIGLLTCFEGYDGNYLFSMDGTRTISSQAIECDKCSQQNHKNGLTTYFHSALLTVLTIPSTNDVIILPPEFMIPQDGTEKQDCELNAAKRWIKRHKKFLRGKKITILGDDLFSHQPFCQLLIDNGLNFILVCKPSSHETLYEWVALFEKAGNVEKIEERKWNGRHGEIWIYRYVHDVPLRSGDDALDVNWCEITISHEITGEVIYKNAFVTHHLLTEESVRPIIAEGRARWKSENEGNNILKNRGYHVDHNFGHGKKHLANFLLTLNLLAFLFHTVLQLVDVKYQLVRKELVARETFFNDLRCHTRYYCFESWDHLLNFMIEGLDLEIPGLPP